MIYNATAQSVFSRLTLSSCLNRMLSPTSLNALHSVRQCTFRVTLSAETADFFYGARRMLRVDFSLYRLLHCYT